MLTPFQVNQKGHRHRCGSCGIACKDDSTLLSHQQQNPGHHGDQQVPDVVKFEEDPAIAIVGENTCEVCRKILGNRGAVRMHKLAVHAICPTCFQVFAEVDQLRRHQKSTGHCYCDQHEIAFTIQQAFRTHIRYEPHVTGFECVDCDRDFGSQQALDHHVAICKDSARAAQRITDQDASDAAVAAYLQVEEANLRCEECDKTFRNLTAQRQHKQSLKHKPLSDIRCFLSERCGRTFTSPSAYITHLESGMCKSGMDRQKLNRLVHAGDTCNRLTYPHNTRRLAPSMADASSVISGMGRLSISSSQSARGVILTPEDSEASIMVASSAETSTVGGCAVLTPSASVASSGSTISTVHGAVNSGQGVDHIADNSDASSETTIRAYDTAAEDDDGSDGTSTVSGLGNSLLTPAETMSQSSGGVVLTPTSSTAGGEWSSMPDNTDQVVFDGARGGWLCGICDVVFLKKKRLQQHLNSPAHETKLYHCGGVAAVASGGGERKPPKSFKTLSGLAQHVEAGSCTGGKDTLTTLLPMFEAEIRRTTGKEVKLLRDTSA